MTIYALHNIQYEYDFILKIENEEYRGSFRALLFAIYDHSSATNFPKNIGNVLKI